MTLNKPSNKLLFDLVEEDDVCFLTEADTEFDDEFVDVDDDGDEDVDETTGFC